MVDYLNGQQHYLKSLSLPYTVKLNVEQTKKWLTASEADSEDMFTVFSRPFKIKPKKKTSVFGVLLDNAMSCASIRWWHTSKTVKL